MSNNTVDDKTILDNQTILLTEVVIKLAAIERILKEAGILTDEKMLNETQKLGSEISSIMASAALQDQLTPKPEGSKN